MTTAGAARRRRLPVGLVLAAACAVACAVLALGLGYGVEELVWDPAHRTWSWQEPPHATAVAWASAALAVATAAGGVRLARW